MRLAVLADIHGNLPAFEAALEHAQAQRADQIVIAGDIVIGAPDSAACWRRARALGCPILRGNHERYMADLGTARADPRWATPQFAPLQWAAAQLAADERAALGALPAHLRLPEAPDLLLVHASLRSDADSLRAHTPDAALPAMFPGVRERLIVRAHNHVAATRPWGERLIVTAGSVGLPLDGSATAPDENSRRLTSFKSMCFESPANNVGPWPASLGCTTNSYSSIKPNSASASGSVTPPTNSPFPSPCLSC